jgi:hypothetical protein
MKKKQIIIVMWILISVLMPIFYFGIIRNMLDRIEYDRILKKYGNVPDPNEKPYPIPLRVDIEPPYIDVLVFTVLELGSITGLTIFISKKDKTDYQKQQIT